MRAASSSRTSGYRRPPTVIGELGSHSPWSLVWWALLTAAVVVGIRMLWMFTVPYLIASLTRSRAWREVTPWRDRVVLGWSGMRGALSRSRRRCRSPRLCHIASCSST
jgi:NhaP-type Na+/H+ or K+/H+ antiporter